MKHWHRMGLKQNLGYYKQKRNFEDCVEHTPFFLSLKHLLIIELVFLITLSLIRNIIHRTYHTRFK